MSTRSFISSSISSFGGSCSLLVLSVFLLSSTGCEENGPVKPDYGPEASVEEIYDAMDALYRDSNPIATKAGAFVHFQTAHLLAGGQLRIHSADTGHTVVKRDESECQVNFHIVEIRLTYKQDGTAEPALKRELELPFRTSSSGNCQQQAATVIPTMATDVRTASDWKTKVSAAATEPPKVTFHRLRTWETKGPAPEAVRSRPKDNPNCLGISNCELTYRHVSFDIVYWDKPDGDLARLEYVVSPEIPQTSGLNMAPVFFYIPGLFKSCVTQMMTLGESENAGRTLVTECQEVVDFVYEATPTPTPTP